MRCDRRRHRMQTQNPETTEEPQPDEESNQRSWILVAAAVGLALVAFGLGAVVGASGTDELKAEETPEVVNKWGEAFVAEDPEALAELYADGAAFNCRAFDFTITRDQIADVVMSDETDFTEFKPTTVLVGDEIIAVEYMVKAKSPLGGDVSTPLIAVFDVDESGLIARSTIDYDQREMFPDMFSGAAEESVAALGCHLNT